MAWAKPMIARSPPTVSPHFRRFGDIGYLCDSDADMRDAVEAIVTGMDADRHARQVAAMQTLRAARTPTALATTYRSVMRQNHPGLL